MGQLSFNGQRDRNPASGIASLHKPVRSAAPGKQAPVMDVPTARNIARRITMILPPGFNRVLPRGYTLEGGALRMLKIQPLMSNTHLYGLHTGWGATEAAAFATDLRDGWLVELSAYMRWQLRDQPTELSDFQKGLRQLHSDLET